VPSENEVIIAAAGGGKTTRIVDRVLKTSTERAALLTYTQLNTEEIGRKIYSQNGIIPSHVEVWSWFSFLIKEMARPYQLFVHNERIEGLLFCNGRSDPYAPKHDIRRFYFNKDRLIYSDKLSQFVVACNDASNGAVIRRIEQRFDRIYIDEIQDMAGYDLEVIKLLLKSKVNVTMVGDHRQATFTTNKAAKNKKFQGANIIHKFKQWEKDKLLAVTFESETYRCNQSIADFADTLFPDIPLTKSRNQDITGHDGVFVIASSAVDDYVKQFQPQVLRYDKRTLCGELDEDARNFGECKGLTFNRILIFPNGKATKWLTTGDYHHIEASAAKMYVAITRARHSVAFVLDKVPAIANINKASIAPISEA
jgi:DNA helicase-2/ATP-dependent DNA helicase PcrA